MQFVYFIHGLSGPASREQLEAAGLGYAFPKGQEFHCAGDSEGPAGMGALVSAEAKALRFDKASTEWHRFDSFFVGLSKDKAKRPRPSDLRLPDSFVDGHPVVLGDKQSWTVPVIRFADGNTCLPSVLRRKEDGSFGYEVRSEYLGIVRICDEIVEGAMSLKGFGLSPEMTMAFVAGTLGINYRISDIEISLLELVDNHNVKAIASAALDAPTLVLLLGELKKNRMEERSAPGRVCATGESA